MWYILYESELLVNAWLSVVTKLVLYTKDGSMQVSLRLQIKVKLQTQEY